MDGTHLGDHRLKRILAGTLVLTLVGCAAQPPKRSPLPDVAEVLPEPVGCLLSVGDPRGVSVVTVTADGAASGVLEEGDVITAIEGTETETRPELTEVMADRRPGEEIDVAYLRGDEPGVATITLGTHPDDEARGMIGITVETAYDQIRLEEADDDVAPSGTARAITIGGQLMLFDPLANTWEPTGIEPPEEMRWVASSTGFYSMTDTEPVQVLDLSTDEALPDDGFAGWQAQRLIGRLGDVLLLVVTAEIPDQPGFVNLGIAAFDPEEGTTLWVTPVSAGFGIPVAAYPSPDDSVFVAVGANADTGEQAGVNLFSGGGIPQTGVDLSGFGEPIGWFDGTSLAFRTTEDLITVYDLATREPEEHSMPATITGAVAATVGDGEHIIAVAGRDMVLQSLLDPNFSAPLASNCLIGRTGDPGVGA